MFRRPEGIIGTALLVMIVLVAFFGPLLAPQSPTAPLGAPGAAPSGALPLGADFLGRDVLSRLLHGGSSVILIGLTATIGAYIVGVLTGMYAGYRGGLGDTIAMRTVDLALAFPPLLVLLVLVAGAGQHVWVLIVGVVAVQAPAVARIVRTASLSVTQMPYVEAALARGDRTLTIWRKDLFPNILPPLLADFGIRFAISIILVASMNYLGLGLQPPASDWALMMSENRDIIVLNLWGVVAPAIALALLTVGVNLVADAYLHAVRRTVAGGRSQWWRMRGAASESAQIAAPSIEEEVV